MLQSDPTNFGSPSSSWLHMQDTLQSKVQILLSCAHFPFPEQSFGHSSGQASEQDLASSVKPPSPHRLPWQKRLRCCSPKAVDNPWAAASTQSYLHALHSPHSESADGHDGSSHRSNFFDSSLGHFCSWNAASRTLEPRRHPRCGRRGGYHASWRYFMLGWVNQAFLYTGKWWYRYAACGKPVVAGSLPRTPDRSCSIGSTDSSPRVRHTTSQSNSLRRTCRPRQQLKLYLLASTPVWSKLTICVVIG